MSSRPVGRAMSGNRALADISNPYTAPQLRSSEDWPRWYLHVCAATRCVFLKWDDPLALPEPTNLDKEYRALYSAFWHKVMSTVDEKYLLQSRQYQTLSAQVNFLKWLCEDESKREEPPII
ncbi:hypothetical protein KEM54_000892 [Ascosphaera aggregata]|nr:hypothetical protein KEM54_000892 [Ascosphaera aggregata]